jgi:hypothetical protein
MGTTQSTSTQNTPKSNNNLPDTIDYLATHYILTQSFQDMVQLRESKYCNDLVILTSDIIGEYLNEQQIQYMHNKIKDGVEINELKEDALLWIKNKDLRNININTKIPKRKLCIGIAKQYVKIAHLFGAIVTTINPTYTYRDRYGENITVSLKDKNSIPSYAIPTLQRINICSERINALINGKDLKSSNNITIQPNFCTINNKNDPSNELKSLTDEPGIPDLELLYNDEYDFNTGQFIGMSDKMKQQYLLDVEVFYKAFTGNANKPTNILKFQDIKLRDFASSKGCGANNIYTQSYEGASDQTLFKQYATHIQQMIQTAQQNQDALLQILDQLFVWKLDKDEDTKQISINPALNENTLDELIVTARNLIIKCYITCETDFIKGLEIFEAIVEKQIMTVTKSQLDNLEKTIQETLLLTPEPTHVVNPNTAATAATATAATAAATATNTAATATNTAGPAAAAGPATAGPATAGPATAGPVSDGPVSATATAAADNGHVVNPGVELVVISPAATAATNTAATNTAAATAATAAISPTDVSVNNPTAAISPLVSSDESSGSL